MGNPTFIFHTKTQDAWSAMLEACMLAQKSIYLEQFILQPDEIGTSFVDMFIERASEGLDVSLILDWWGCRELLNSNFKHKLEDAGVKVRPFRPPSWRWLFNSNRLLPRDHRKLLIIDEERAFIGGVCMYDDIRDWRDTMVEVDGGIAQQINHIFKQTCHKIDIRAGLFDDAEPTETHPHFETHEEFSIYANAPDTDEYYFSKELIKKISTAKKSVKLATPYFTPGTDLTKAITTAAARNIDVQIVVSAHSKYAPLVVGQLQSAKFIEAGVHFYYYDAQMLHLKMMIIDDEWGAIGSCNLDGLSIYHNQEAMLVSDNKNFVSQIVNHFEVDRNTANLYTRDQWRQRSVPDKIAALLLRPFRRYL